MKQPPDRQLRVEVLEVLQVPLLVGVGEDEVERAGQLAHQLVRVSEPRVDALGEAGLGEVLERRLVTPAIDLECRQPPAGLREGPGDPHARVAGGRADLERAREALLQHQVVQDLPVRLRDVPLVPRPAVLVEEGAHPLIDRVVRSPCRRSGQHRQHQGPEPHTDLPEHLKLPSAEQRPAASGRQPCSRMRWTVRLPPAHDSGHRS